MRAIVTRACLLVSTALGGVAIFPIQGWAQGQGGNGGLEEIVVTAQKREQVLQDVPIAITAFTEESLEANRITTVNDLSGLAPGLTVRPSAGGISTPAFTMRGQVSFGVVAGSDKQISIYLDGVYISSPRGSIFDLPDIQRIEVLRGPQGTLFGRNATGGAVSITTRDPTGEPHVKAEGSFGNRDYYRMRLTAETPAMGPFTGYFTFVRNYRHGDIRNARPGLVWNRTAAGPKFKTPKISPNYLGTVDSNSYFGAVKFEPADTFRVVYKYDRNEDNGTPEGTAFVGYDPNAPLTGALVTAMLNSQPQPVIITPDARRPKAVDNGWVTNRDQTVQGHSVTATWNATDNLTLKDVFAYRKVYVHATSAIDGLSSQTFTQQMLVPYATLIAFSSIGKVPGITDPASAAAAIPGFIAAFAPQVGGRFVLIGTQATSTSQQWSDEFQVNWDAGPLQATAGALWFHSKDLSGGPGGVTQNSVSLQIYPANGFLANQRVGTYADKATSIAAYAQLEYSFTPELTAILGGRITRDKKDESFTFGNPGALTTITPPTYKKTKPNYLIGLNWKPNQDTLIYGKFSTSFVSGGTSVGVLYQPETATSWEAGVKADLLDRKLRVNLALFDVKYEHFQSPQGTTQAQSAALIVALTTPLYGAAIANQLPGTVSTFVADQGTIKAKGFELEVTAAPVRGVSLGGSVGYTDVKSSHVDPVLITTNGGPIALINRPKWTGTVWASYESPPLFGSDTTFMIRGDGNFRSRSLLDTLQSRAIPSLQVLKATPAYWTFNARASLEHIDIGHGITAELAVWAKNLTNEKYTNFALVQALAGAANFITARTYGVDFGIEF
jgi:iron complex outermembrane receptor protein